MGVSELKVIYLPDDDGYTGQISATVRSGQFSAQGTAWFDHAHVKRTFLNDLRLFPLPTVNSPTLEGGFWNPKSLDQCHLRIIIRPHDSRGTLLVHVDVSSEVWKTPDADVQHSATVRFLTEYEAVGRFAEEFEQVLNGKRDAAVLTGVVT